MDHPLQVSVTTSWASLPAETARSVSILNNTGASMDIRHNQTSGDYLSLKDGQAVELFPGTGRAETIQIKAGAGASGVQVVIRA